MRPVPSSERLSRLLDLARKAAAQIDAAGIDGAVMWLTATQPDALVWFPLDRLHPLQLLFRFVAPYHWSAIGVSGSGLARPLDDAGRVVPGATPGPVSVTLVVDRSGSAATLMRRGDEPEAVPVPEPPQGMVADACRRALGLSTAPPPGPPTDLWTLCWLDRLVDVLASALGAATPFPDWPSVARLHPAATQGPPAADPAALAREAEALSQAWPWSRLRAQPEAIHFPTHDVSPDLARWMDDGMWARWLLSAYPARDDLLDAIYHLLPPHLAAAVSETITPATVSC